MWWWDGRSLSLLSKSELWLRAVEIKFKWLRQSFSAPNSGHENPLYSFNSLPTVSLSKFCWKCYPSMIIVVLSLTADLCFEKWIGWASEASNIFLMKNCCSFVCLWDRDSSDTRLDRFKKFFTHDFVHKILVEFINRLSCCCKYGGHFKILNDNMLVLNSLLYC